MLTLASARHLIRHPLQLLLAVLGIGLGVAVVVAVDLANEGARRSFLLSSEIVSGTATHTLTADGSGLEESLYRTLRVELGLRQIAPVVDGYVALADRPEQTLHLIGVDPFAELALRGTPLGAQGWDADLGTLLTEPGAVLMSQALADSLGAAVGDRLQLITGPGVQPVLVAGLLDDADAGQRLSRYLLADIATAQELTGQIGRLNRIDLWLSPAEEAGWRDLLGKRLPPAVTLEAIGARDEAMLRLSGSFQLNLTAMSLLALVVGIFLIYNTMTFSVVQRRPLLGRLRAVGVERRQLMRVVLLEALVLGSAGTLLGLLLGMALGQGLLELVSRTVDDLYYTLTVVEFHVSPMSLGKGLALGLVATGVAAWLPAREAAEAPAGAVLQRSDLERRARHLVPRLAGVGLGVLLLAGIVLAVSGQSLLLGFSGLFILILGCALMAPAAVTGLAIPARAIGARAFGLMGRMASRDITRHLSRTGVATAALMVAVATTVGVGVMVDSFRGSVAIWLEERLNADLYLTPVSFGIGDRTVTLNPDVVRLVRSVAGVEGIGTYRRLSVDLFGQSTQLIALDPAPATRSAYRFKSGRPETAWPALETAAGLFVSEPLAYRHRLEVGEVLDLPTPAGPLALPIAGIFYDYGSEHGMVVMHQALYERHWPDPAAASLGIYSGEPDLESLAGRIEAAVGRIQPVSITPSRDIREASLAVFDRTFTITNVLRLLAVLVAFVGVLSALMAMLLERAREFAVLRANGLTPRELGGLISLETLFLGTSAGVLAIPTGLLLAWVLIFVINRRAFGWTMQFQADPMILLQALLLAMSAALLAGLYPAWRLARTPPAVVLAAD
jgi:putative ABC transport system permease protein